MYRKLSAPLTVHIEISARCPNNCIHCYNFWRRDEGGRRHAQSLSEVEIRTIFEKLSTGRIFHIVLTGGEPLTNKRGLFFAIERAKQSGMTVSVNSTLIGLLLSDVDHLRNLGVSSVLTSILGPNAEIHDAITQRPGSFEKTVCGIRMLQEAGVPVSVNMVVSKKNIDFIKETGRFTLSLGIRHFNATRAGCPGNCDDFSELALSQTEFRRYLEDLRGVGLEEGIKVDALEGYPLCGIGDTSRFRTFTGRQCSAGLTTITIGSDGNVRPCSHLDVEYGNLIREDLPPIWERMDPWRAGAFKPVVCKTCKLLPVCGGGCRMEAKMETGSLSDPDPYMRPNEVAYTLGTWAERSRSAKPIELPESFALNPAVRWRNESFGISLFRGVRSAGQLNADGKKFIEMMGSREHALEEFSEQLVDLEFKRFFEELFLRGIFLSSTHEERKESHHETEVRADVCR